MPEKINIAIDGYSGCGKSTLAKALAAALDYVYIDSGAMYRAVTWFMLSKNVAPDDLENVHAMLDEVDLSFIRENNTNRLLLNGRHLDDEIRTMEVNNAVSHYSTISSVRKHLVLLQQQISKSKGVVMDGRDIGTVVMPDAALKLFLVCELETRVARRKKELDTKQIFSTFESVRANFIERDRIDSTRADSPLKQAADAILIDNTHLTEEQQFDLAMKLVMQKINGQ